MKKGRVLIAFVLTLSVLAILASCGNAGKTQPTAGSTDDSTASSAPADASSPASPEQPSAGAASPSASATDETSASPSESPAAPFSFRDKAYKSGAFSISYPQITSLEDLKLQDALNTLISDSALRDVETLKSDNALQEYKLKGMATYNSPELLSIYYIGYKNLQETAYSTQFLYTQIIDVGSQQSVRLTDLVKVSKSFVQLMLDGTYSAMGYDMTREQATSIKLYLNEAGADYWLTELKNADSASSFTATYLTENALVISVSVPHAMGDHIEITLPFKSLEKFKTKSPVWAALTGTAVS